MASYHSIERRSDDDDGKPSNQDGNGVAVAFAAKDEERITRKVDTRILPFLLLAYLFQQLDKSTLMYASVFGLAEDANLVGKQLSWLGSILYLAQLIAQPLAAMILVKYPLGKVIAIAILMWGLTLCVMSRCTTFPSLLFTRFVLGAFESIIAPSCLAVTQMWWAKDRQTTRVSAWHAMNGIAPIVGGILCYMLGHLEVQGLFTYQILFATFGIMTICLSFPVWRLLPDTPAQAKFLTYEEKIILSDRLRASRSDAATKVWKWDQTRECALDPKTWCWVAMHLSLAIPAGGLGVFGGLIIKDFGFDKFKTILFNIPFGLVALGAISGMTWFANRGHKGLVMASLCFVPMLGCSILLLTPRGGEQGAHMAQLLFAYVLIQFQSAFVPLNLSWQAQNTAGETKKQCTTALMFIGSCFGNVVGPLLFDPDQAPVYKTGLMSSLFMFAVTFVISTATYFHLTYLNAQRKHSAYVSLNEEDEEDVESAGGLLQQPAQHLGADLTDRENKSFRYMT
ncbi:MFS general substrate transporter [Sarocladium strictum]